MRWDGCWIGLRPEGWWGDSKDVALGAVGLGAGVGEVLALARVAAAIVAVEVAHEPGVTGGEAAVFWCSACKVVRGDGRSAPAPGGHGVGRVLLRQWVKRFSRHWMARMRWISMPTRNSVSARFLAAIGAMTAWRPARMARKRVARGRIAVIYNN